MSVLHYRKIVSRKSDDGVFHDETGYWMWDAKTNVLMHSLNIPRAVSLLAGTTLSETNYKDGKLDGHLTRWWDDGERMLDSDYIDGDLDGDEVFHNLGRGWTRTGPKSL